MKIVRLQNVSINFYKNFTKNYEKIKKEKINMRVSLFI